VHYSLKYAVTLPGIVTANFRPTIQITLNLTLSSTLSPHDIPHAHASDLGSILDRSTKYLSSEPSRLALGPFQPPLRWAARALPGVKRPGHKAGHSPQSSAEVKNQYICTFTPNTCLHGEQRDNIFGLNLTSKQAPSSQIPSKYYLPYGKNTISHDGRAPIIVRVRSLVVFLSPCRQMQGLYLNYTATASLQILSNSPSNNPSPCKLLCT